MIKKKIVRKEEMDEYFKYAIKYAEGDLSLKSKIISFGNKTRYPEEYIPVEEYANSKGTKILITKDVLTRVLTSYLDGEADEEDLHFYGRMIFNSKLMISEEYDERFEAEIDEVITRFEQIDSEGFDKKEARRLLKLLED
jgi:hypothetical protein